MLDWIRSKFRRTEVATLPIRFAMDRTAEGHEVRVYKRLNGEETAVTNVAKLWQYGYQEQIEEPDRTVAYVLDESTRQTLLALRSLNPSIDASGALLFDFAPPMLAYLRTKEQVSESPASQRLTVSDQPARPAARIDYEPNQAVQIETGFQLPGSDELVQLDDARLTGDKSHVLLGDTFVPMPKLSDHVQAWLRQPLRRIHARDIPEFFQRDLVLLKKEFTAVLTDRASQIQIISEPFRPIVHVDQSEPGWLEFHVGYQVGSDVLPHNLLSQIGDKPYFQLDDFLWVKNDPRAIRKTEHSLQELAPDITVSGYRAPVSEFVSLDEFIRSIGGKAELSAAYQAFLDQLTGFQVDETFRLSKRAEQDLAGQNIRLRPYQRGGIHWLDWLHDNQLHGLLADDMGLGKTLQTICVIRRAYEKTNSRQHSLVLAPRSVIHHWEREFNRFYPGIRVYPYHGPHRRRRLLQALEPIVFVTTYATAANDLDELSKVPFLYLVLDEATRIKNPDTKRTHAVKALNAAHRLALSGTPVENRPAELWSMFDFLMRGHLGKYGTFKRVYEDQIAAGDRAASKRLGKRIRPFLLRRTKDDVARDLPDKIEMDEWCSLTPEQQQLYGGLQETVQQLRTALQRGERVDYTTNILPVLTKLKQICDHPALISKGKDTEPGNGRSEKFDWVVAKIEEIRTAGEQVVVFSHFLGMLDLLETVMQRQGFRYIRIDGSTTRRQAFIDQFNAGEAGVALCSIQATGYGVNLTAANHVIHADRWWNPAVEDQATDRVHRIGQDKTVYVYRIMVEGTLEERIDRLLFRKRDMADGIVRAAVGDSSRGWTRDDLLELLRPLD